MRDVKTTTWVVSILAALILVAAGIHFLPGLLGVLSGRQTDDDERAARERMARQVDMFATQMVSESTGPDGPPPAALTKLGNQDWLKYATEHSGGELTAAWVAASDQVGGALGSHVVRECYAISFHDLGTSGAGYQVTRQSDCRDADALIRSQPPAPSPAISSKR